MYNVTSYDVCVEGFNRLRTQSEVLFPIIVDASTTLEEIKEGFEDELNCCMRPSGFDYDEARRAFNEFCEEHLNWAFKKPNPFNIEAPDEDFDEDDTNHVFLFIYMDVGEEHAE